MIAFRPLVLLAIISQQDTEQLILIQTYVLRKLSYQFLELDHL